MLVPVAAENLNILTFVYLNANLTIDHITLRINISKIICTASIQWYYYSLIRETKVVISFFKPTGKGIGRNYGHKFRCALSRTKRHRIAATRKLLCTFLRVHYYITFPSFIIGNSANNRHDPVIHSVYRIEGESKIN